MLLALLLAAIPPLSLPATKTVLPNGLTVIVSEDHRVPGVAVDLWYHVGSADERPGRTGFAHLFEHLMFMGAKYAPYPKFDTIMEAYGGTNNASTWNDATHYYEVGPSNLLGTFLWLEADRMATLGREMTQKKLDTQRKVVLNERRQSYENRPYGKADLAIDENLFPPGYPYHHPVIGSAKDIESATLPDVKRFFATWYVPSNAILTVVGDVSASRVQTLVQRYFGWMPKTQVPAQPKVSPPPTPPAKLLRMTDRVKASKVILAWVSPKDGTEGDAAADLLATILANGKASRLYQLLVQQRQIASSVSADEDSRALASVFEIDAMAQPGHTPDELRAAIRKAIDHLLANGVTEAELSSARRRLYTDTARALEGLQPRAEILNHLEMRDGNPNGLLADLQRYERLTPASFVQDVRGFLAKHELVIEVVPEQGSASGKGARP